MLPEWLSTYLQGSKFVNEAEILAKIDKLAAVARECKGSNYERSWKASQHAGVRCVTESFCPGVLTWLTALAAWMWLRCWGFSESALLSLTSSAPREYLGAKTPRKMKM